MPAAVRGIFMVYFCCPALAGCLKPLTATAPPHPELLNQELVSWTSHWTGIAAASQYPTGISLHISKPTFPNPVSSPSSCSLCNLYKFCRLHKEHSFLYLILMLWWPRFHFLLHYMSEDAEQHLFQSINEEFCILKKSYIMYIKDNVPLGPFVPLKMSNSSTKETFFF